MARTAWITIKDFGTIEQQQDLADKINDQTLFHARVTVGVVVIQIRLHEVAQFFDVMQSNDEFNWIEFCVQLD